MTARICLKVLHCNESKNRTFENLFNPRILNGANMYFKELIGVNEKNRLPGIWKKKLCYLFVIPFFPINMIVYVKSNAC